MLNIPANSPVRRRFWWAVLITSLLFALPLTWMPQDSLFAFDSALYTTGAWSLARGQGYHLITHVTAPPITLYPPLTSAYLSLWFGSGNNLLTSLPGLHLGMVLLGAGCGLLWFWLLSNAGCPDWFAALTSLSCGLSINWLELLVSPMSEPLFLFLILLLAVVWVNAPHPDSHGRWWLTGALAGLLYLTRSAALGIIAGLALLALLTARRGQWKVLVAYFVPLLLAMGWWQCMKLSAGKTGYGSALSGRVQNLGGWDNAAIYMGKSALGYLNGLHWLEDPAPMLIRLPWLPQLTTHHLSWLGWSILAVASASFMIAALRGCWMDRHPTLKWARWPVGLYLLQICVWPYFMAGRGLWAVLPFGLRWAWLGFADLTARFSKPRCLTWSLAAVLLLNLLASVTLSRKLIPLNYAPSLMAELQETANFADHHIPVKAPIAISWCHPFVHFFSFSGRLLVEDYFYCLYLGQWYSPVRIEDQHVMPQYLFASRQIGHWDQLEPFLKQHPGLMTVVFESSHGNYLLLRINEREQLRLWQKDHDGIAPPWLQ